MRIAEVFIEYPSKYIDRPFFYNIDFFEAQSGCRVMVDFNHKEVMGVITKIKDVDTNFIKNLPYEVKPILKLVDKTPLLNNEGWYLVDYLHNYCVAPLISCVNTLLPPALKSKHQKQNIKMVNQIVLKTNNLEGYTPKQQAALIFLQNNGGTCLQKKFREKYSGVQKKLLELHAIEIEKVESSNWLIENDQESINYVLTKQQKQAIQMFHSSEKMVNLLFGVTGCGKTEVFIQLARQAISEGKQVIVLVPEISLTSQMIDRFTKEFEKIAIYHSKLSAQEKYEQYRLVQAGKVDIIIGTRSAVFLPTNNLGLIIMDEEHDPAYKQTNNPSYHARDVAIMRSKYHNSKVLLASATPSLESFAKAYKHKYGLIEMNERINPKPLDIELINMQKVMYQDQDYLLSDQLHKAIDEVLLNQKQAIILLNRRGYAPISRCLDCGDIIKCPNCDLALNYHKDTHQLVCHTCGYHCSEKLVCSKCGSTNIENEGIGTQKLEEYLKKQFPQAKILRMDRDTTSKKYAHEQIINAFKNHEADILLGTQMIAKGLDFPYVQLVGILNGDATLKIGDYYSSEYTFDLLMQASGRSGRKQDSGKVLIQTYDPNNPIMEAIKKQDYRMFFNYEMKFRHLGNYPPYVYLTEMIISNQDYAKLQQDIQLINEYHLVDVNKIGPVMLLKKHNLFRSRILISSKNLKLMVKEVNKLVDYLMERKVKSKLAVNVNPINLEV